MVTQDEILNLVMSLSPQERQTLLKSLIAALASSTSVSVEQQQAVATSAGRGDTGSRPKGPRKTVAFRLRGAIVKQLEDAFHQLNMDGFRIRQVDLREDIVKLGLEHVDELRGRYQNTSSGPQKQASSPAHEIAATES